MIARILTMALAAFFLGANIESVALAGGSFDVTIKESEAPGAPDSPDTHTLSGEPGVVSRKWWKLVLAPLRAG